MAKKQARLTKKERKALDPGPRRRTPAVAERHFGEKDRLGGPAQQMMDFVEPLMEGARANGHVEVTNRMMSLGMIFWNMALLPESDRAEALRKAEETVCKTEEDRETLRQTAAVMIARHEQMFPWLHDGRGR